MCSNRNNLTFNRNNNIKITTSASVMPFNNSSITNSNNNTKSSLEHVYFAKLVNFDRQRRLNNNSNNIKNNELLSTDQININNEMDLTRQRNRLRNVASIKNNNDYETLINLESKLINNEDSRSTSSCCSSSIEKIAEEELEEDYNNILQVEDNNKTTITNKNNNNKSKFIINNNSNKNTKNKYSNSTAASSAASTTGSFSSSSASSISSALSSIAINNHSSSSSSSNSSSSSSSPSFLNNYSNNNNLIESNIYSRNYKVRSNINKNNEIANNNFKMKEQEMNKKLLSSPALPSTPPPQLTQNIKLLDNDRKTSLFSNNYNNTNSNSTTITKTTMSSWLQSNIMNNKKQLTELENNNKLATTNASDLMNRKFLCTDLTSAVSTKTNNSLLANKLLQYSAIHANQNKLNNNNSDTNNFFLNSESNNNEYCDLSEQSNGVVYRNNVTYFSNNENETNKREFFVLNNDDLSQFDENEHEDEEEETTATEEMTETINNKESAKTNRDYYFNSTLITPLTPLTSEPTIINSCEAKIVDIKNYATITKKSTSSTNNSTTSTTTNNNIKSASTSYLLSKITSIASLTMPKHNRTATTLASESILNSYNPSSPVSTNSTSSSSTNTTNNNIVINKTNKFFNRKQSQTNDSDINGQSHSPLLLCSENFSKNQIASLTMSPSANINKYSSCSSSSSSSNIGNNNNTNNVVITSSRRPFKKRSQSTHTNLLNKAIWYYNQTEDYWLKSSTNNNVDSNSSSPKITLSSTLKKRKSLNNKIASVVATRSMSSFNNNNNDSHNDVKNESMSPVSFSSFNDPMNTTCRIRLNQINIKHLTLVELKYLKQICFNFLQKQFQQLQLEQQKLRKQQLDKTTNSNGKSMNSNTFNSFSIRVSIPKDESIKTVKTKSIAIRSKSVDFKFFDEFKENYFSKKNSNPNQQVFGQSLYKCILNDLEQSSRRNSTCSNEKTGKQSSSCLLKQNRTENGKSNTSLFKNSKKWRSSNQSNLLIASKFDLNILSEINGNDNLDLNIDKNLTNNDETTTTTTTIPHSKRNSVLFEALDLKNMSNKSFQNESISKQNSKKLQMRSSSISNNLLPPLIEKKTSNEELNAQLIAANQNLSIRSEGLVPNIVKSCCSHISEYGLDVVGIFRIDSSKKRIKEIKEMYDSGKDVILNETFNPNDSACILKEYLRSLPEPLLTRDLYSSFLATCKIKDNEKRLQAVRYLICLLPVPNRDTLEILLQLLDKIKVNSNKESSPDKKTTTGNKMDAFNLAMVFGPNILKKHKLGSNSSSSKLNDYATDKYNLIDDIDSVISCTKYLIENTSSLFYIESNLHNELIQTIQNLNPNELNAVLIRKLISLSGITKLEVPNLNGNNSDTSGYSSSVKSVSQLAKSNTDDSLVSPMNNIIPSKNQYKPGDFIDYNLSKHRTSRTKLHKIVDNFDYIHPKETEPIHFVNSPSHSPESKTITNGNNKQAKRISSAILCNQISKTFSNEIYNNQIIESYLNNKTTVNKSSNINNQASSSSLLLMIQSSEKNQKSKQKAVEKLNQELLSKATKSLSNLNQQQTNVLEKRRQSGQSNATASQCKVINSNAIQICSKFYDKSKYNIIGEQETLV